MNTADIYRALENLRHRASDPTIRASVSAALIMIQRKFPTICEILDSQPLTSEEKAAAASLSQESLTEFVPDIPLVNE